MRMSSAHQRIGNKHETYLAICSSLHTSTYRVQEHAHANTQPDAEGHGGPAGHVDGDANDHAHTYSHLHANAHCNTNDHANTHDHSLPGARHTTGRGWAMVGGHHWT